jgi:hypothetical protein
VRLSWTLLALCLSSVASHETLNVADMPGFEALLLRSPTNRNCETSYARDLGLHKALRHSSIYVETKPAHCPRGQPDSSCYTDHVLIVGQNKSEVLRQIRQECKHVFDELDQLGSYGLETQDLGFEGSELVLSPPSVPGLDLYHLPGLFTGDSSNRVDIVFFSDGCT